MTEHILFVFFGVFDPCGAARREDGQIFAFGHAAEDFGAFFDRREVGGESGIANEVETEAMHGDEFIELFGNAEVFLNNFNAIQNIVLHIIYKESAKTSKDVPQYGAQTIGRS